MNPFFSTKTTYDVSTFNRAALFFAVNCSIWKYKGMCVKEKKNRMLFFIDFFCKCYHIHLKKESTETFLSLSFTSKLFVIWIMDGLLTLIFNSFVSTILIFFSHSKQKHWKISTESTPTKKKSCFSFKVIFSKLGRDFYFIHK